MKGAVTKINKIFDKKFMPKKGQCVVYQLIDKNNVIFYVGQTRNFTLRLYQHIQDGKELDSFYYENVEEKKANNIEASMIVKMKPTLNKSLPSNDFYVSKAYLKKELYFLVDEFIKNIDSDFEMQNNKKLNYKYINKYRDLIIKDVFNDAVDLCKKSIKLGEE